MSHVKCLRVTFRPLKTRPSRCLATSDIDHSLTEPHIQEERRRHLCQCESLKTRKLWFVQQNVPLIYMAKFNDLCGFKLSYTDLFENEFSSWRELSFVCVRGQLKCDGTRAETRFRLSAKRTSPFKSEGASVQSTTGRRAVRIRGSNVGYTMLRGSVKGTG
jgi:hypothetical protein